MNNSDEPLLSVVVVIVSDTTGVRSEATFLEGCLESLTHQNCPPPMEIIVPYRPPVDGLEQAEKRFPGVRFVRIENLPSGGRRGGSREHHDPLRARGMLLTRGEIIGLLEDHTRPDANWCARVVEAHKEPYSGVGGAIENGIDRPLNWAVYFCDFGKYQNPVPEGESTCASDANVSYKRSALEAIRQVWADSFLEMTVNGELMSRGEKLALSSGVVVYQYRSNLRLTSALKERLVWGRSYAATRSKLMGRVRRLVLAGLSPALPVILLWRMVKIVAQRRRCTGPFLKALPLTVALTVSWSYGEFLGYCTGRPR